MFMQTFRPPKKETGNKFQDVWDRRQLREYLKVDALFSSLSSDELDQIIEHFEKLVSPAKTVVMKQGDAGDSFWMIGSAKWKIS